jgi:D-lactate dehydrogenase (cytochrome)
MQLKPDGVAASDELVRDIVDDALARGGTCTGEHGVGLGKIGALEREHGDLIPLMQAIRASFDPNGIMNPGKVLPSAPSTAAS